MLYITKPKYRDVVLIPNPFFFFSQCGEMFHLSDQAPRTEKIYMFFLLTGVLDVLKKKQKNRKKAAVQTLRLMFHRGIIIIIIIWE